MTPHYRYVVDIETRNGLMIAYKVFMRPAHRHSHPFSKRLEGLRRRRARKIVIATKRSFLT